MGRSRKSFDLFVKGYKLKDLGCKATRIPVLKKLGQKVFPPEETTLTWIPVYEKLDLAGGYRAPISIIESFIRQASDHLILNRCPCRSENGCKDFDPYFGCTFLGPAVREVDPEVGRLVSMEEALEHLWKATESGLISWLGTNKGDALMLGVKDHKRLMTICHCCPCCCITNGIPLASRETRDLLVRLEGVHIEVTETCNGCGRCVEACTFKQISIVDGVAVIGEECKGCGRCAMVCKRDGVRITIDNPDYVDQCIERISALVEVK